MTPNSELPTTNLKTTTDFLEIKLHKNKPAQQFRCRLMHREPGHVVLLYTSDKPGRIADMHIAAGSRTLAHYWQARPYVAWRMFDAAGSLIGTLLHICANVSIASDRLSYEDMLLDVWIAPDGGLRILDEDELEDCARRGLVSDQELRLVHAARLHVVGNRAAIIAELEAFEHDAPGGLPVAGPY